MTHCSLETRIRAGICESDDHLQIQLLPQRQYRLRLRDGMTGNSIAATRWHSHLHQAEEEARSLSLLVA